MRTVVVTHYFPPEVGAPQARLSEFARHWARSGDQVTVLTGFPNHPSGVVPPEYRGAIRRIEQNDGYGIVRTWLYATPNEGVAKKTLGHLSFMATSALLGRRPTGDADVVIASSPTFFVIFSAWYLARRKQAKFIVEIRDLWPAIFVELGVLTNPLVIHILEAVELAAYRAADAVVVVSDGFRDNLIDRGIPASKVFTIPNGVDLELFKAPADSLDRRGARARLGVAGDDTLVLYIGAHGISHGLAAVADAAALLVDESVHFAFVGSGASKAELEAHVRGHGITNVTMLSSVPREEVPALLDAADICLVPLRDVPLFSTFIPSKIFEYFGAGKAVVGSVAGEPAEILRRGGALVVTPEDVEAIASAVRVLAADPQRRMAMGREGRAFVAEHFDRAALADRYRLILSSVTRHPDTRRTLRSATRLIIHVLRHPANRNGRTRAAARVLAWQLWQVIANRPLTTRRLLGGMKVRCHPHSSSASAVFYNSAPEYESAHLAHDLLAPDDVFVDAGANVGVYSLIAASVPGTEVHAFEPSSATFARLQENIELNRLDSRVFAHRLALGNRRETVRLTVGRDTTNVVLTDNDNNNTDRETPETVATEAVAQTTLDSTLEEETSRRVALVKIDVEGREDDVLAGAMNLLTQVRPVLIIEANDIPALKSRLAPIGYRPFSYDPDTGTLAELDWDLPHHPNLLAFADVEKARKRLERRTPRSQAAAAIQLRDPAAT